jgi:hypothetical protein
MTGRNMVNAIKTKNTPAASSIPKYTKDCPEGTLIVEDWKLPGKSLTPFETLKLNKKYIDVNILVFMIVINHEEINTNKAIDQLKNQFPIHACRKIIIRRK